MADQELRKKINSRIGMLKLSIDDLPRILEKNQLKEVTKIATFIENKLEQIEDLKRQVQEAMFEDQKEVEEIIRWGRQLEDRLGEFIQGRKELEAMIEKLRIAEEEKSKTQETEVEEINLLKRNSRRTEDRRSQSKNESRPGKENQRRRKKKCKTGG